MSFKHLMEEYSGSSDRIDMIRLTDTLDCLFYELKENHPELYTKYMTKVKLSNRNIPWDKEQAEYAVKCMKNKDGTKGEHWTYEQTSEVSEKNGYHHNLAEWYYTLNMIYSDYYSQDFSTDTYVRLACDNISDIDAPKNASKKVYVAKHF